MEGLMNNFFGVIAVLVAVLLLVAIRCVSDEGKKK